MSKDTQKRNLLKEALAILMGETRMLPERKHLEALASRTAFLETALVAIIASEPGRTSVTVPAETIAILSGRFALALKMDLDEVVLTAVPLPLGVSERVLHAGPERPQ